MEALGKDAMVLNAIIYFALWMLAMQVWDSFRKRGDLAALLLGLRPRHAGWGLLLLITTLMTLAAMATLAFGMADWMRWGWFSALTGNGGSMFSAGTDDRATVPKMVIYALYALLALALPLGALVEEKMFRRGAEHRTTGANMLMALGFALCHMVVGFPIFAALALFPLGMLLTFYYRRSWRKSGGDSHVAVLEASRVHLMNNTIAICLWLGLFYWGPGR